MMDISHDIVLHSNIWHDEKSQEKTIISSHQESTTPMEQGMTLVFLVPQRGFRSTPSLETIITHE